MVSQSKKIIGIPYISTRSEKVVFSSSAAILKGIAPDGGLFVPGAIPLLDKTFLELAALDYRGLARYIIGKFFNDFLSRDLDYSIKKAYDRKFDTSLIAPVVKKGDFFFLELYHGATAAFKDMALSILPYLMTSAIKKEGILKEVVILTATSGDTGKAALQSFAGVPGTKIMVFYPAKGVSLIQERQMVTQEGKNTSVCAIDGNFDDAQRAVKNIFNDREFNDAAAKNGYMLSSANSINIGRLIPQIVYYINCYLRMMENADISEGEKINFVVPTGNFGNILAAYYAGLMGIPLGKLICASNENKVLYDFLNNGIYDARRALKLTISPSMDILISSNLERLIFDLCGHDSKKLASFFKDLANNGIFKIDKAMKEKMGNFWGGFATEAQTYQSIREVYQNYNYLIDTHTAVGYSVYKDYLEKEKDPTKTVIASTASPFKFPLSVLKALNGKKLKNGMDEFQALETLSNFTGIPIPGPLKNIGQKEILHHNFCQREQIGGFVSEALGIR